jgi:cytochrome P450
MYPPAWIISRLAAAPLDLGPATVRRGDLLLMSQWVNHHDARWFPEPWRFNPDRWVGEVPRFAFFPFGGGGRVCIGESFAGLEGVVVLATLLQKWHFRYVGEGPPRPQALITLRPRDGMPMRLSRREASAHQS